MVVGQSNKVRPLPHSIYTKLTPHIRAKIIKLLEKNISSVTGFGNGFLRHQKKKQIKYISSKSKTSLLQMSPSRK